MLLPDTQVDIDAIMPFCYNILREISYKISINTKYYKDYKLN